MLYTFNSQARAATKQLRSAPPQRSTHMHHIPMEHVHAQPKGHSRRPVRPKQKLATCQLNTAGASSAKRTFVLDIRAPRSLSPESKVTYVSFTKKESPPEKHLHNMSLNLCQPSRKVTHASVAKRIPIPKYETRI